MFSNIGLRKQLAETGLVQIGSNLINKQLLEEIKQNRNTENFVATSNGVYFTKKITQDILSILVDGAFEDGDANTEQRTQKLQDIHNRVIVLTQKSILSLAEAGELHAIYADICRYFGNFKLGTAADNHYFQEVSPEDYKTLEAKAITIHKDINTYITLQGAILGEKNIEEREEEILNFQKFAQQFEQIQDKKELTIEIETQYNAYLGRLEKYFPGVYGLPQMIGTNYFPNISTDQYLQREDQVTDIYDKLTAAYMKLNSGSQNMTIE